MGGDYRDAKLSAEERAEDLLSRMTVEEKIAQLKARVVAFHHVAQSWVAGLTPEEKATFQRYLGPATWKMYHEDRDASAAVTREAWKRRARPLPFSKTTASSRWEMTSPWRSRAPTRSARISASTAATTRRSSRPYRGSEAGSERRGFCSPTAAT